MATSVFKNGAVLITGSPQALFTDFVHKYNKVYTNDEFQTRFKNFKDNIAKINAQNAASPSAVFGINHFSDMSEEEFRTTVLMSKRIEVPPMPKDFVASNTPAIGAPDTLDWRAKGAVTPVKNQEQCGSCWAFSATQAIESAWILAGKATNETVNLAPQQIVDCDTTDAGCNGGDTPTAYEYVVSAGGLESNDSYPYTGQNGKCDFKKSEVVASITGYQKATSWLSETELQTNLVAWGPLSICLDAASWQNYQSGVLTHLQCAFINFLDHCVQLVGYNAGASSPYWIVRNSWTTDWGIEGYIWLEMWHDTCGLAHEATWPTV